MYDEDIFKIYGKQCLTSSIGSEDEELPWIEQAISNGADSNIEEEVEDLQKKEEVNTFISITGTDLNVLRFEKSIDFYSCKLNIHRN